MERSIENIWKKGFEAEAKLSAPVISNLYKKKSKLVVQRINSTSKKDNLTLIPAAVIFFSVFAFIGKIILGIYGAVLIFTLFFVNRNLLKNLGTINIKDNTYNYLLNYRNQVKNITRYSTWIAGLGFPLVIIPGYWMFFQGTKVMANFMQLELNFQILLVLGIMLGLSLFGILGFRLSTKIIYGKLLTRLESTLEDMEELMKV